MKKVLHVVTARFAKATLQRWNHKQPVRGHVGALIIRIGVWGFLITTIAYYTPKPFLVVMVLRLSPYSSPYTKPYRPFILSITPKRHYLE